MVSDGRNGTVALGEIRRAAGPERAGPAGGAELLEHSEERLVHGYGVALPVRVTPISEDQPTVIVGDTDEVELAEVLRRVDR